MKRRDVVTVRFKKETRALMEEVCDARGEHISSFVRRAVLRELADLGFLSQEHMKALGKAQ